MKLKPTFALVALVAAGFAPVACGGAAPAHVASPRPPSGPVPPASARLTGCARAHDAARAPVPVALTRAGSTVALARLGDRTLAYVADEDDAAIHVVDVDARRDLGATPLGGRPAQLMFLGDGRLAVALRDRAEVRVLEPTDDPAAPLEARCSIATDAEPWGLALTPDDGRLYVSSAWGRSLAAYDVQGADKKSPAVIARQWTVSLAREPRSIVVSDDASKVYVTHAVGGRMSIVDTKLRRVARALTSQVGENAERSGKMEDDGADMGSISPRTASCQSFALAKLDDPGGRVLVPQVLVDPGDTTARASGYGSSDQRATEAPDVAVLDESSGDVLLASLTGLEADPNASGPVNEGCLLPRAAAYDTKSKSLLVACLGIDSVVAYDALASSPARAEKRRWAVASGPNGVAVDSGRDRAVVWSQFERVVDVLPFGGAVLSDDHAEEPPPAPVRIALQEATHGPSAGFILGRVLFHASGDARISQDGRACASCHPDGRDDAITWATPNGPRRSIALAGRVADGTPLSWSGSERSLEQHLKTTFGRLKGDGSLKGLELAALEAYVQGLPQPPPTPAPTGETAAKVARGAEIFASESAGCAGCHAGSRTTDNRLHDVKSRTEADVAAEFNTPSLRFVSGGGPYFHDGRYANLHEVLTNADEKMGHTAQFSSDDVEALEAYLRTL